MTQNKLKGLLNAGQPKPAFQKGKPLGLSTEAPADESAVSHSHTIALSEQSTENEEDKRVKRGYALRESLILRCKFLALKRRKLLYEVMEAALEEYLEREEDK